MEAIIKIKYSEKDGFVITAEDKSAIWEGKSVIKDNPSADMANLILMKCSNLVMMSPIEIKSTILRHLHGEI